MDKYTEVIYPDVENDYPKKLCDYVAGRFFQTEEKNPLLLDVGCNKGTHMKLFSGIATTYGLDIRVAQGVPNIYKCDLDKERFPFADETFDFAWSKSVIEHVHNPSNLISETYRTLRPGGRAVFMTPDWTSQMSHFWDDFTHVQPWTRKSLKNCLRIHGYRNVTCELFYQLPWVWNRPWLKVVPRVIGAVCPQSLKWKDGAMENGKDRKLIRFSKELMLLASGEK